MIELIITYRKYHGELCSDVAHTADLDESIVERLEFRMFELAVIEAEEVVHYDVASKGREGICQIKWLCMSLNLLHAHRESINMTVDDVNEVEDRAT